MQLTSRPPGGSVDIPDPLIDQTAANEIHILAGLLFLVVVLAIGILSRRMGNLLLFSLSLCAFLIFLVMALLR